MVVLRTYPSASNFDSRFCPAFLMKTILFNRYPREAESESLPDR